LARRIDYIACALESWVVLSFVPPPTQNGEAILISRCRASRFSSCTTGRKFPGEPSAELVFSCATRATDPPAGIYSKVFVQLPDRTEQRSDDSIFHAIDC
jgi:hypothetical protein